MEEAEAALAGSNPAQGSSNLREGITPSGVRVTVVFNPNGKLLAFSPSENQS